MKLARAVGVLLLVGAAAPAMAQPAPPYRMRRDVTGIWQWRAAGGRFAGRMILVQDGSVVKGAVVESNGPALGDLDGVVDGRRLAFRRTARVGREVRTWDYTLWLREGGSEMQGSFLDAGEPDDAARSRVAIDFSALRVFPSAPGGPLVGPPPPPGGPVVGPPPPALRPIDEASLAQLVAAINGESFTDNQLALVTQAAGYHHFLVDQVARLLPLFTYEETRLQVLEQLRPRLLDPQNGFKLLALFTYSDSKTRAQKILMRR